MEFAWDEDKRKQNAIKHGVDFEDIHSFEWVSAITARDERRNYNETRFVSYGLIFGRLYACVYTQRDKVRRIISLRKANQREEKIYEEKIDKIPY